MLLSRLLKTMVLGAALLGFGLMAGCDRQSGGDKQPQAAQSQQGGGQTGELKGTLDRSQKGSELPQVTLTDSHGQQLPMAKLKGKPTLINLWATWCAPCIAELPTLQAIANRADVGVEVVTVSQDTIEPAKVQQFLDQRGFAQLPAWIDTRGDLPMQYGAQTLPATVYYDAAGREVWRFYGGRDWSNAESMALLDEGRQTP